MSEPGQFTDVLWMSRYHYDRRSTLLEHQHTFYQIIFFVEGKGRLHIGTDRFDIECPEILLVKPGRIHGLEITDKLKTIDIKFVVTDTDFERKLAVVPEIISKPDRYDTLFLLESMLEIGTEERAYYRERCRFLLNLILMEWLESDIETRSDVPASRVYSDSSPPKSTICTSLIDFIDANLAESLDSQAISEELGFSYRYISQSCLKEFSMTPMQLIRNRRIHKAKVLLMNDSCEIKEIVDELGFKSVYHFSRVFRNQVGQPPGKWKDFQLRQICRDITIDPDYMNKLYIKTTD